ncbi:hypothetical protein [Rhodococcus triatomae]|nr:hypothetical protein G419_14182 [Rhodococcus triatomae BKS 15-14]
MTDDRTGDGDAAASIRLLWRSRLAAESSARPGPRPALTVGGLVVQSNSPMPRDWRRSRCAALLNGSA